MIVWVAYWYLPYDALIRIMINPDESIGVLWCFDQVIRAFYYFIQVRYIEVEIYFIISITEYNIVMLIIYGRPG